jgi:hypothetical protein
LPRIAALLGRNLHAYRLKLNNSTPQKLWLIQIIGNIKRIKTNVLAGRIKMIKIVRGTRRNNAGPRNAPALNGSEERQRQERERAERQRQEEERRRNR